MRILVGTVIKAQGIKGELRVNCLLDNAHQLDNVTKLYLADKSHKVVKLRCENNIFVVQFEQIIDRTKADLYRNWEVYADKEDVFMPEGSYFLSDMLGCNVYADNGDRLGIVIDVAQYGSADVYTVQTDRGDVSFPWLKSIIVSIDIDMKKIVLNHNKLQEVMVIHYEN